MSNVKIETLVPVHIGSGNMLQNNTDFIVSGKGDDKFIHIIDERKILELIGEEHVDNWLLSIEKKEPTLDLVKRFAPSSNIEEFSKQRITCFASNIKPSDTLKEIVHNGTGLPYIPGSSIKGAIRTAILGSLSGVIDQKEEKISNRGRVKADKIEKELFGNDPNSDIFRFIRVGDAYFGNDSVVALRLINLNIRNRLDNLWDSSKPQIIQAIAPEEESLTRINIAEEYYNWVKMHWPEQLSNPLVTLPSEIRTLSSLFMLINEHTRQLIEEDIDFWRDVDKTGSEDYIDVMQGILDEVSGCAKGKSCVLRIGHASGWRFITGAWTESLDNFETVVINATRPNNRNYSEYDFPKTRRLVEDSDVLGFVKLTIDE